MLGKLWDLIFGIKLSAEDPLFGSLTTQRIKGRGRPVGDPPEYEWFATPMENPLAQIDQVIIHAGLNGAEEGHRLAWTKLLSNAEVFRKDVSQKLFENYLWHKVFTIKKCRDKYGDEDLSRFKNWPNYENADVTYRDNAWWLDIYQDEYLEVYIPTDWDEEHSLRVSAQHGKLVDAWQD